MRKRQIKGMSLNVAVVALNRVIQDSLCSHTLLLSVGSIIFFEHLL